MAPPGDFFSLQASQSGPSCLLARHSVASSETWTLECCCFCCSYPSTSSEPHRGSSGLDRKPVSCFLPVPDTWDLLFLARDEDKTMKRRRKKKGKMDLSFFRRISERRTEGLFGRSHMRIETAFREQSGIWSSTLR